MKKILRSTVVTAVFLGIISSRGTVLQAQITENLRIGLEYRYKEAAAVPIDNNAILVGYGIGDNFEEITLLESGRGFTAKADDYYYAQTAERYSDFRSARDGANAYGDADHFAIPAFINPNEWHVYIGGFSSKEEVREFVERGRADAVVSASASRVLLADSLTPIMVYNSEEYNFQIKDSDGKPVQLDDKSYRGVIEISRYQGKNLTAVNVIDYDSYLYSVIPSEMPAGWDIEALKAQTVASRSYTYTRNGVHNEEGYGLCDGVHCQVYHGYDNEAQSALIAVDETRGLAAYYDDKIINATFFSSSGGVTENSENVWTYEIPYLRGVNDHYEEGAKEWERQFTIDEITDLLYANSVEIGSAVSVSIESISQAGRVTGLRIQGANGSHLLEKEAIRTFFAKSSGGSLESRYFSLQNSNSIVFSGRGWGHGVGMSQYGAKAMAEAGFTYEEILTHYYTDIEIK